MDTVKPKRVKNIKKPIVEAPVFKIARGNFVISFGREERVAVAPIQTLHSQTHDPHNN